MPRKITSRVERLSSEAKDLYKSVTRDWGIKSEPEISILLVGCEALDRLREAQETLRREGLTIQDRFQQSRPHPCCQIEREARSHFLAAMKDLRLDYGADEEHDKLAILRGVRGAA